MQRSYIRKILLSSLVSFSLAMVLIATVSICAFAKSHVARTRIGRAEVERVGQPAPSFNVRTLEGVSYNNASLGGSPTLLQFWTTQCADCRDDQAAVDEIDSKFAGHGLVVLAIDEGEAAATVQKYLREHPRTVRIVLDERREIARRFGKHRNPYYVLIDRQGRIAGTQRGAAGQQGLMSLLKRAGLQERQPAPATRAAIQEVAQGTTKDEVKRATNSATKDTTQDAQRDQARGANQDETQSANKGESQAENTPKQPEESKPGEKAAVEPPKPSGMKVIDVPPDKNSRPGQPLPKAVFVLTNGERLESDRYTMDPKYLHVAVEGEERIVPMNSVDLKATESANHARGIDLKIPTSKSEVFVSF